MGFVPGFVPEVADKSDSFQASFEAGTMTGSYEELNHDGLYECRLGMAIGCVEFCFECPWYRN